MSSDTQALEKWKNRQLQPSEDLRRPDQHGQLPHIISTTFPDRPLHELQIDDILEINWNGVRTAIRDAIVRVTHEGDLSSSTLRETIQLIALALRKLEMDDADLRRRIGHRTGLGFVAWLIVLTPSATGKKLRGLIGDRRREVKRLRSLGEERDAVFGLRAELADAVDRKIDALLVRESPEYRDLYRQPGLSKAVRGTAGEILAELGELEKIELRIVRYKHDGTSSATHVAHKERKKQIEAKIPAFIRFTAQYAKDPVEDRGSVDVCLRQLIADLDAKTAPAARAMEAMRDERKRQLYGAAAEAFDDPPPQ